MGLPATGDARHGRFAVVADAGDDNRRRGGE